jgi:uncharacterized membrane protein YeaQ/YmgE (transglycosylase-associated protein family)
MIELIVLIGLLVLAWFVVTSIFAFVLNIFGFAVMVLVWMFIGWIAGQLLRGKSYGPIYDALLGLGGGIVGSIVLGLVGISTSGAIGTVVAGVVGALILVAGVRLVKDKNFAR